MNYLIFHKENLNHSDILLTTLSEDNYMLKIKIPGILKSQKRNAFHLYPATIWNFTITNPKKEICIPRESHLVYSPIQQEATYNELILLKEMMQPITSLVPNIHLGPLYKGYEKLLKLWQPKNSKHQIELLNFSLLHLLKTNGLLSDIEYCTICSCKLCKRDVYIPSEGAICNSCKNKNINFIRDAIPLGWIQFYSEIKNIEQQSNALTTLERYKREAFINSEKYRLLLKEEFEFT